MCGTGQRAKKVALVLYRPSDDAWIGMFICVILTMGMVIGCLVVGVLVVTEVFGNTVSGSFGWCTLRFRNEWACS